MAEYQQREQRPAERDATEHGIDAGQVAPAAATRLGALDRMLNQSPRAQSLQRLRQALDAAPKTQAQVALQHALAQRPIVSMGGKHASAPDGQARDPPNDATRRIQPKPALQARGAAIGPSSGDAANAAPVVQRYEVYRKGKNDDVNLTPRAADLAEFQKGLSTFEEPDRAPFFIDEAQIIETAKLGKTLKPVVNGIGPFDLHVSIMPEPEDDLKSWATNPGSAWTKAVKAAIVGTYAAPPDAKKAAKAQKAEQANKGEQDKKDEQAQKGEQDKKDEPAQKPGAKGGMKWADYGEEWKKLSNAQAQEAFRSDERAKAPAKMKARERENEQAKEAAKPWPKRSIELEKQLELEKRLAHDKQPAHAKTGGGKAKDAKTENN